ncbi:hypothetical protein GGS20DRAFT_575556 [Poronia punctata]|nr:hypothetical protein GGS20DRAFT_575556 [Poronia punctata]
MEDHHLDLTSPDSSDMSHLGFPLLPQHIVLAGIQNRDMGFPLEPHAAGKDPLTRWYMNDGPWDPLASRTTHDGNQQIFSGMGGQHVAPGRRDIVPSECMPQSDSGYGSYHNRHSIANGSVCDDSYETNIDAQSVMGRSIADISFPVHDTISNHIITPVGLARSWSGPSPIPIQTTTKTCPVCHGPVKTASDIKKHHQRHTKPFKCDVSDCSRREKGFSTPNDLARHKRSVHPGSQASGNRYVCPLGDCAKKDKIWPRADNFKAHLKRLHKKDDLSDPELNEFVYKEPHSVDHAEESLRHDATSVYHTTSEPASREEDSWPQSFDISHSTEPSPHVDQAENEDAMSLPNPQHELADLHIPNLLQHQVYPETTSPDSVSDPSISLSPPIQNVQSPDAFETTGTIARTEEQVEDLGSDPEKEAQSMETESSVSVIAEESPEASSTDPQTPLTSVDPPMTDETVTDPHEPETTPAPDESYISLDLRSADPNAIKKLVDTLQSHGLLEQYGYKKKSLQGTTCSAEGDAGNEQSVSHRCSTCTKAFRRKCELKKHETRHKRPYGCTSPGCDKRFGSKNDWKRHENTQHYMLEMWRCDEQKCDSPSEMCEKVCYRREGFKAHLDKDHQVVDSNVLEKKLEKCRVGRNCDERFWCGFCQTIVESNRNDGQASWAERFDHIDEHITGRNNRAKTDISEWKSFDSSQPSIHPDGPGDSSPSTVQARQSPENPSISVGQMEAKRKRDSDLDASKRSKRTLHGTICCQCGDFIMMWQIQCCNWGCEHVPCGDCKSTHKDKAPMMR